MRLVDLGAPYGPTSFPDDATDAQIIAEYDKLEAARTTAAKEARMVGVRLADLAENEKPTLGKVLTATGLNIREGAVGTTKQAVGNISRMLADALSIPNNPLQSRQSVGVDTEDPEHPLNILREAGKDIASQGDRQIQEADELTEGLGGGLPVKIAAALGSTAGASSPALVAAPFGITAAALAAGAHAGGSNISQFKKRLMELNPDLSEQEAFQKAQLPGAITGAVTGVLTRTFGGVEKLIEKIAAEGIQETGVKAILGAVFKAASMEFPEEYLDQLAQGFTEKAFVDPNKPYGDIFNEAGLAGLAGFALGGLTAGGVTGVATGGKIAGDYIERSRVRRKSTQESRQRIANVIAEREAQDAGTVSTTPTTTGSEAVQTEASQTTVPVTEETQEEALAKPVVPQTEEQPVVDKIDSALTRAIDALQNDPSKIQSQVIPVWIVQDAARGALIATRAAYRGGKAVVEAIGDGINALRNLPGFNEQQANAWLTRAVSDDLMPSIAQAGVTGTVADVGRIADEIYGRRETGASGLERMAYERKQYRNAASDLKRLSDLAYGRFGASAQTEEPIIMPDPTEGVTVTDGVLNVDDTFSNTIGAVGVQHNPENVKAIQLEIFFEKSARRLNGLTSQIANLQSARETIASVNAPPEDLQKLDRKIEKMINQAAKLGSISLNGLTVAERSAEISDAQSQRPELTAQRDALSLEPVAEFFGKNVGAYRNFKQQSETAIKIAGELKSASTDPAELRRLTDEAAEWIQLPQDVKQAIREGNPLTPEQKASAFASLSMVFENFDINRRRMIEMRDLRNPELLKQERELLAEIAQAKIDSGSSEVFISDVLAALDGETGGTGNLQGQQVAQALKGRISAIKNFALTIGSNLDTHQALFEWLSNPTEHTRFITSAQQSYGVDQSTLEMILDEVRRNPAFGSAIVTLINSADEKMAKLPVVQLEQIENLLKEDKQAQAASLARTLIDRAESQGGVAEAILRKSLRALEKNHIERQALQHGVEMFNELGESQDFNGLRDAVSNSPYGLVEPMVEQNNTTTTLKPFGNENIPAHAGLELKASDDPFFKAKWYHETNRYYEKAIEHLDAYYAALASHQANPQQHPAPAQLGFDLPKIRGLKHAVETHIPGSFLDNSLLSENKRWKNDKLSEALGKKSWFRQHDFVSKVVGGQAGLDLRARLGDFVNHYEIAQHIKQKYSNLPDLRHSALRSHPNMNGNMMEYREHWNELSHWGRMFGSPVRAGFILPRSGNEVTKEDIAFLKRQIDYEEELRRRVTESNPVSGVRLKQGDRTLVRAGAFVGDLGLPRHLNRLANIFIADIIPAYATNPSGFDAATDLSASSTNPIVQFWNKNVPLLVQHVLDSKRQDRSMRVNPQMQRISDATSASWISTGTPAITSLEDLVNELIRNAPAMPGLNVRDVIISGLNKELLQYNDSAKRIESERTERQQARNPGVEIAFSADNEFTKPAAKLELPSQLYDYGSITTSDFITSASRANHERIVAYATAVSRAINDLQGRIDRYNSSGGRITPDEALASAGGQVLYGGSIKDATNVIEMLRRVRDDFVSAYKTGSLANAKAGWFKRGLDLAASAVLALPTVALRNMTQGQFETYMMSRMMGISGHRMTMWRAMNQMIKNVARSGLTIGSYLMKKTDLGASFITGKDVKVFSQMVDQIAKMVLQPDFRSELSRVKDLGFDNREGLYDRIQRLWNESAEFHTPEELTQRTVTVGGKKRKLGQALATPIKAIRPFFEKIGPQQWDLIINSSNLVYAHWLEQRLNEVAMKYGENRERQGLTSFSFIDPKWRLEPSEWADYKVKQDSEDSLAFIRTFFEGSAAPEGFQLEKNLWDYYQARKAGQPARVFTDAQFDAVQRKLLADFNASTPANRSSAGAANTTLRSLQTLHGYVSDGLLKMFYTSLGGARDRGAVASALTRAPILLMLAFMSVVIGYVAGGLTGAWSRIFEKQASALPDPLEKDFWTNWKNFRNGTLRLGAMNLFYVGDLMLWMQGQTQGNRGFDPVGRVFPVSMIQRLYGAAKGVWNTYRGAGDLSDSFTPLWDVTRSMVPYWKTSAALLGMQLNDIKQGERIIRGEANNQDLLPNSPFSSSTGQTYGPTTIVRRNITDYVSEYHNAIIANDSVSAEKALLNAKSELSKLERFYYDKYIAAGQTQEQAAIKSKRDLWNDYQELNPVVSAMMGKRPTTGQYELIRKNISAERSVKVDKAIDAWKAGAVALFGREGQITREDVSDNRASVGRIPGLSSPTAGVSMRMRSPLSRTRTRSSYVSAPSYRPSGSRLRTRRVGIRRRRIGVTRRLSQPKVSRPRTSLGRRRRRVYA